jgi:hypothetical protein
LARQRCRLWHANSAAETQAHELTAADLRLARRWRADQSQASINAKALGLQARTPQLPPVGPWPRPPVRVARAGGSRAIMRGE